MLTRIFRRQASAAAPVTSSRRPAWKSFTRLVCSRSSASGGEPCPQACAGTVMWLLSVGGRAYAGRDGDLQERC